LNSYAPLFKGINLEYFLTIFKQETPGITVITSASLLTDKLRNVSKVARWKDLRYKFYPPFVY